MEMEEVSEQYSTPCFIDGLNTYDGEVNLEYKKNMISNDFVVKLCLEYEQDDVKLKVVFGRSFLKITKGIVDFRNVILTIYPDLITYNDDSDDELDELLASVDVSDLPPLDVTDIPPFMCSMGKSARIKKQPSKNYKMSYNGEGPSLTIKRPLNQEEVSREELENDIYERILIHNEPRPIIETLNYSDQHKKLLDSVLLDKLKLDGEVEVEEAATEEFIRSYKAIKEKNDPGVFVLPIRLEAKSDFHSLADTGSNINVIPYRIYEKLGRDQVKPVSHKITMLDHSKAEPIGILKDVLCQSYHEYIKGTTSTFDGIVHKKFYVANVRNSHEESDSDDVEEYCLKTDEMGKPFYGLNHAKYLSCDDPMDRALALQESLNPFKKNCVWKKAIAFIGSLPVPLQHVEWIPNHSGNFAKNVMVMGNGTLRLEL
ncbi:hypothetical protein Tco_0892497 [Tanacetum coccineum]|uniref:Uncharacterized protein n=1 Tax=Tanacetum coccineum TaxID=301880 RepID=A0ABQ5C627_9ASTR